MQILPVFSPKPLSQKGFPGGSVVKKPPADAGDLGSIPGSGRSSEEGNVNPLQHSSLGIPHGQRNLVGYCYKRVGHDLAAKQLRQKLWRLDSAACGLTCPPGDSRIH